MKKYLDILILHNKNCQVFQNNNLGTNDTNTPHTYIIPAIAAWQGINTVVGGQTPAQYMIAQFGRWDGNNPGVNGWTGYPCAYGGIRGQRDLFFIACSALAKLTPAIWNALGNAQKNRITLAMQAQLVSLVWQMSGTNPYILNGGAERTIRGDQQQWGRGFNPNFTAPGLLGPAMIAQFLGPAAANNFLTTYNHNNFVNQITAARNGVGGPLDEVLITFNALGLGVTPANLTAALKRPGNLPPTIGFNQRPLYQVDDANGLFSEVMIQKMWTKVVKSGFQLGGNGQVGKGYGRPGGAAFGIFEPTNIANSFGGVGRNAMVGMLAPGAPAHPLAGQVGMAFELDATDGGLNGSGGGPRSAMKYAYETAVLCPTTAVVLIAYNALLRNDPNVILAMNRQKVGMQDLNFRNTWGHRDFSKGGRPWSGTGNNGNTNWNQASANAKFYQLLHNAHDLIVVPWAA